MRKKSFKIPRRPGDTFSGERVITLDMDRVESVEHVDEGDETNPDHILIVAMQSGQSHLIRYNYTYFCNMLR